jgi:hypothetical protein
VVFCGNHAVVVGDLATVDLQIAVQNTTADIDTSYTHKNLSIAHWSLLISNQVELIET